MIYTPKVGLKCNLMGCILWSNIINLKLSKIIQPCIVGKVAMHILKMDVLAMLTRNHMFKVIIILTIS